MKLWPSIFRILFTALAGVVMLLPSFTLASIPSPTTQLCRYSEPESGDTLYAYDAAGQLKDMSQGESAGTGCGSMTPGKRTTMYYDILGQNFYTDIWTNATQDIIKTFDANGNITALVRGLGSGGIGNDRVDWNYTYDNANNLISEILSLEGGTKTYPLYYGYDGDGFMVSRELPSGRYLTMVNDGLGRLKMIKQVGPYVPPTKGGTGQQGPDPHQVYADNINYNASGAITGMDYGNGQVFTQTFTPRLQPLRLLSQSGGSTGTALDLTYGYDVLGKVTSMTNGAITGDNRTYNYDDLGRLTSATGPWGNSAYKYDALGNILEKTVGSRTIGMNYDGNNRLSSHVDKDVGGNDIPGTSVSLGYDSQGNVTQLGGLYFIYSLTNQPTALFGSSGGSYLYDGNKKRVRAIVDGKTIYNVYDASGTLVHVDESTDGNTTDYIGAPSLCEEVVLGCKIVRIKTVSGTSTPTWLHMDHLGSAQTGTDALGAVAWREKYTPYGTTLINPLSNNDQAGFTGHIKDSATGLTYMQARYYDPLIVRFLSTDAMQFNGGNNPAYFNRYAYVNNDPVNLIDPTGECFDDCRAWAQQQINAVKGGWKALRGYGSGMRYYQSVRSRNPGPHNDRAFVNTVIGLGANFASNNPKLVGQMGLDTKIDKGIGYNIGKHGVSLGVTAPLAPQALAGKLALGTANTLSSVSGSVLSSAYQALGVLQSAGISPNSLSNEVMGQIGAVAINDGKFSYNSDTNVLTGTWQYQTDNGAQLTGSVGINIGSSPNAGKVTCTGSRIKKDSC